MVGRRRPQVFKSGDRFNHRYLSKGDVENIDRKAFPGAPGQDLFDQLAFDALYLRAILISLSHGVNV